MEDTLPERTHSFEDLHRDGLAFGEQQDLGLLTWAWHSQDSHDLSSGSCQ